MSRSSRHDVVLVLDYDNTLFPTKYFERNRRLVFADVSALPPKFRRRLAKLDESMAEFVTMASERCRVAVVTAASREWITFSSFVRFTLGVGRVCSFCETFFSSHIPYYEDVGGLRCSD